MGLIYMSGWHIPSLIGLLKEWTDEDVFPRFCLFNIIWSTYQLFMFLEHELFKTRNSCLTPIWTWSSNRYTGSPWSSGSILCAKVDYFAVSVRIGLWRTVRAYALFKSKFYQTTGWECLLLITRIAASFNYLVTATLNWTCFFLGGRIDFVCSWPDRDPLDSMLLR